jgi:hypothetical protein
MFHKILTFLALSSNQNNNIIHPESKKIKINNYFLYKIKKVEFYIRAMFHAIVVFFKFKNLGLTTTHVI